MAEFAGLPLLVLMGDAVLKKCAEEKLSDNGVRKIAGGHILLRLFHNPGVALGVLKKHPRAVLLINGGLLCAVTGVFVRLDKAAGGAAAKAGLALMLGGGASNFLDRLRAGYVTDYISFDFGKRFAWLKKIVFNCSDFCVFAGAFLFVCGFSCRGS